MAPGVNHTVRLPRARRPASYLAQLVTRCRCFGMWRRQVALALKGTAGVQASGKGPSSYTAQLPTPTGRSVQQGDLTPLKPQQLGCRCRRQPSLIQISQHLEPCWQRSDILIGRLQGIVARERESENSAAGFVRLGPYPSAMRLDN